MITLDGYGWEREEQRLLREYRAVCCDLETTACRLERLNGWSGEIFGSLNAPLSELIEEARRIEEGLRTCAKMLSDVCGEMDGEIRQLQEAYDRIDSEAAEQFRALTEASSEGK